MIGVSVIIIVMSVMNGFRDELTSRLLGINGHINIYSSNDKITTKIFKNYNIEENLLETKCIFTWDSDSLALNNIFDLSLCYIFFNIYFPNIL